MIKRVYILFLGLFVMNFLNAQELKLGVVLGGNMFESIEVDLPYYSPPNAYITFIESESGEGLVSKKSALNAGHIGGIISGYYKKFSVNIEPQFYFKRNVYVFKFPQEVNWIVSEKSFRIPLYFTYKLFKAQKSVYFLGGLSYCKGKNWDLQNPTLGYYFGPDNIYYDKPFYGNDIMNGFMYNNKGYFSFMAGIGKQFGKFNSSLRFQKQSNTKNDPIAAKKWSIEISINRHLFSSKDITKKHFLYVD